MLSSMGRLSASWFSFGKEMDFKCFVTWVDSQECAHALLVVFPGFLSLCKCFCDASSVPGHALKTLRL